MIPIRSTLKRVVAPAELPVSLDEVRADLRFEPDYTAEDTKINSLILAATDFVSGPDGVLGKALINQTWCLSVPQADRHARICLTLTPVQSITSIKVIDPAGEEQTLSVADFHLFGDEDIAYIEPKIGSVWPSVYDRPDAIRVTFVCGFGDTSDSVPNHIKQAIRLLCCHWYENREAVLTGTIATTLPMGVDALLSISRKGWVG